METHVDEDAIRKLAKKIAKEVKTEADLGDFSKLLSRDCARCGTDRSPGLRQEQPQGQWLWEQSQWEIQ